MSYLTLYENFDNTESDVLKKSFVNLQTHDLGEVGSLAYPAQLAALAMLGFTPDKGYRGGYRKLNLIEKWALWLIGEDLKYPL